MSDGTWAHHFEPKSKQQSKEQRHITTPRKKKFKSVPSAGNIMLTVFWEEKGIIHVNFLPTWK
jgi:hypothetical protein